MTAAAPPSFADRIWSEAEQGRAVGRAAVASIAAAARPLVDNPWWILVLPGAVYGLGQAFAAGLNLADLVAAAAAWFAGRRWGVRAMLPVIFLCLLFLVRLPA